MHPFAIFYGMKLGSSARLAGIVTGFLVRCKIPVLLLIVTVLPAGCAQTPVPAQPSGVVQREATVALPTSQPTPAPSPSSTRVLELELITPTPTSLVTPTMTPIPDESRGLVVDVIDGDTVAVVLEGDPPSRAYLVRYIGIDAPPNTPDNPWGVVAYEANRKMTNLKVVRLVRDQTDVDDEGRLFRYVYVGDELMSIILAEQGLARADSVEPDTRFQTEIEGAVARAREGKLGLWGPLPTPTPVRGKPATVEPETTAEPDEITPAATPARTATATSEVGLPPGELKPAPATLSASPSPEATPEATATAAGSTPELQGPQ